MSSATLSIPEVFTVGQLAAHFRCAAWKIRRIFERGAIQPASRVGAYRVVAAKDLPRIERALRECGYIETKSDGDR